MPELGENAALNRPLSFSFRAGFYPALLSDGADNSLVSSTRPDCRSRTFPPCIPLTMLDVNRAIENISGRRKRRPSEGKQIALTYFHPFVSEPCSFFLFASKGPWSIL
jgi:hypothetical protein